MTAFGMPKSCVSCEKYTHKGFAYDEHSPFKEIDGSPKRNGRVQYGKCNLHGAEVFGTELCDQFDCHPDVIASDVTNRPVAKEMRQEGLF